MFRILASLWRNQRLLKDFVVRDLKARYVGSSMGFFWSVVFPIINLVVYHFVFRVVLNTRWNDSQGALEVALVMLAGIVIWAAFAETVSRSTNCLVENANLIQKVVFPSELLPAFLTKSSLINMAIGLPVLLAAVGWFGYVATPDVFVSIQAERVVDENENERFLVHPLGMGDRGPGVLVPVRTNRGYREPVVVPLEYAGSAQLGVDFEGPTEVVVPPSGSGVNVHLTPVAGVEHTENLEILLRLGVPEGAGLQDPDGQTMALARSIVLLSGSEEGYDPDLRDGPRPGVVMRGDDYRPLQLGAPLLILPLMFALQFLFTVGLGYFLATLNAYVRDTYHLVGVGVMVWMFATPIFYPAHMVEKAGAGFILALNPMHWLIECYRQVLLFGAWPDPWLLLRFGVVGLVTLALGARFFLSQKARFPDLL